MNYRKTFQGAHEFSAMVGEQLVTRQYMFVSKTVATRLFKAYCRGLL